MKNWIDTIKKMSKDPKGKAILFFGFYLVFFALVILFVRTTSRYHTSPDDYEKGNAVISQIGSLLNYNYAYRYTILPDDALEGIDGKRYNNKNEELTYRGQLYYCNEEACFTKEDNWIMKDNPNPYALLLDPNTISFLLENSYLEAKTSYESGKVTYHYQISVDTLNKKLHDTTSDLDFQPDSIIVEVDDNKELSSITFQLDHYGKYQKLCKNTLKIIVEYSDIGKVEKIENPILKEKTS